MSIRVVVADDHPVVRRGLLSVLKQEPDIEVVGEAKDGWEAVRLTEELDPDVVLIDLKMPELDGVEAIRRVRATSSQARFIILTTYDSQDWVFEGLKAGARGYVLKDSEVEKLTEAIRRAMRGEALLEPVIAAKLLDRFGELAAMEDGDGREGPTDRELEVLQLLAKGATNKEIAAALFVSENTVKTHVTHLSGKLQARGRAEIVAEGARRRWISL